MSARVLLHLQLDSVFPQMTLRDMMFLERNFLHHLQFTVSLKASMYDRIV